MTNCALENFRIPFQPKTPENGKDSTAAEFLSISMKYQTFNFNKGKYQSSHRKLSCSSGLICSCVWQI
jgi:hypothetical protein